ncbi:ScbR family autoregulator-binding transcription factor [Streptomyces sp. SID13726]|uniref:ScbR family autoregulator-binding transcription factor n=1 Tax=Streptomyces sp. SID13726 TaxID=2706058 RepID=UPI0013B80406|nr:ScbR family autoregulator-binding transcription factor [Streptomyces sp. SID13726]NEB02424.1 TetR/AcrR family transcriptional regulator [Streptomyces sp. SID13726]
MVKQERAERTLRRIISAAADRFEENGYSGTSLDDITRAAGVSKGAFYFHFASKKQVADAVMEHSQGLLEDLIDSSGLPDEPALQRLIDLTHGLNRLLHSEPTVRTALRFHREWPGREPEFDHYALWYGAVGRLLGDAAKHGELSDEVPGGAERVVAMVTLFSVESLTVRGIRRPETAQQVTDLWDVLLAAVATGTAGPVLRTREPAPCEVR